MITPQQYRDVFATDQQELYKVAKQIFRFFDYMGNDLRLPDVPIAQLDRLLVQTYPVSCVALTDFFKETLKDKPFPLTPESNGQKSMPLVLRYLKDNNGPSADVLRQLGLYKDYKKEVITAAVNCAEAIVDAVYEEQEYIFGRIDAEQIRFPLWMQVLSELAEWSPENRPLIAAVQQKFWEGFTKMAQTEHRLSLYHEELAKAAQYTLSEIVPIVRQAINTVSTLYDPEDDRALLAEETFVSISSLLSAKEGGGNDNLDFLLSNLTPQNFIDPNTRGKTIEATRMFGLVLDEICKRDPNRVQTIMPKIVARIDEILKTPAFGGFGDPEAAFNLLEAMKGCVNYGGKELYQQAANICQAYLRSDHGHDRDDLNVRLLNHYSTQALAA